MNTQDLRPDLRIIYDTIDKDSKVLDIGCGNGQLLFTLQKHKNVDARGIELSQDGVNQCITKGLSVIQGDADTDLADYQDKIFDYTILSQTLQATRNPLKVVLEMTRIGKKAIISFPNFGYWKIIYKLIATARMPITKNLPYQWFESPNIHLLTIRDFTILCEENDINIIKSIPIRRGDILDRIASLGQKQAIMLISGR